MLNKWINRSTKLRNRNKKASLKGKDKEKNLYHTTDIPLPSDSNVELELEVFSLGSCGKSLIHYTSQMKHEMAGSYSIFDANNMRATRLKTKHDILKITDAPTYWGTGIKLLIKLKYMLKLTKNNNNRTVLKY